MVPDAWVTPLSLQLLFELLEHPADKLIAAANVVTAKKVAPSHSLTTSL
jgi:hypothetical protein